MKKNITKEDVSANLLETTLDFEYYINKELDLTDDIKNENDRNDAIKRLHLIVSWLSQWLKYIIFEKNFSPKKLKRYSYGELVFVNLGFRVGSEFGGPHYAIVINKYDSINKQLLTIIPLSSLKDKDKSKLGDRLYIGGIIKKIVAEKLEKNENKLEERIKNTIKEPGTNTESFLSKISYYNKKKKQNKAIKDLLLKMSDESIALTNQIVTISKMRIINPKTTYDSLSNITLPNNLMKNILEKVHKLYG